MTDTHDDELRQLREATEAGRRRIGLTPGEGEEPERPRSRGGAPLGVGRIIAERHGGDPEDHVVALHGGKGPSAQQRARQRAAEATGLNPDSDEFAALVRQQAEAAERPESPEARWRRAAWDEYEDATIDTLDERGRDVARRWVKSGRRVPVLLLGPIAVGKTHLAHALIRDAWLTDPDNVTFALRKTGKLLREALPYGQDPAIDYVCDVDYLLLDGCGDSGMTEHQVGRLEDIVDARWDHRRPTIATSNLDPLRFREAVRERTASRLIDRGIVYTWPEGAPNRRLVR